MMMRAASHLRGGKKVRYPWHSDEAGKEGREQTEP